MLDAELLSQLYVELTGGRQIGLELAADHGLAKSFQTDSPVERTGVNRVLRQPRVFSASPEELERHRAFIGKLTDPLWLDSDAVTGGENRPTLM